MEAIDTLRYEHRVVHAVCDAALHELDKAESIHAVDAAEVERFVEFFRFFANSCHDPKEEDLLFTMLHREGLAWDEEPLAGLTHEHEEMRVILDSAAEWVPKAKRGDQSALPPLVHNMRAYVELVRGHVEREEETVFPMALEMLTQTDHDELTEAFETVACDESEEGAVEYFKELARELVAEASA